MLSEVLHEPPSPYGLVILLPVAGYTRGNAGAIRFSVGLGTTRIFVFGLALSLGSGVMLAVWCLAVGLTSWALFVPMAISSIGNGLSQPPGIAAGLSVYPRIAGAASGLIGFLQMMVAALGTLLVGQLPEDTALSMVLVVGSSLALALVFRVLALRLPDASPHSPAALPAAGEISRRS